MRDLQQMPTDAIRPPRAAVLPIVRAALLEDVGAGDLTTESTIPADAWAEGWYFAKSTGVVCGLWLCEMAFSEMDPAIRMDHMVPEPAHVKPGDRIARVIGPARAVLSAERVGLNFMQRLSGIATMASQAMEAVAGTKALVLDTRKTTPGLRILEKYAVRAGGAANHRFGLYDMVLIKDNHIRIAGGIGPAVAAARRSVSPMVKIEVEAATLDEVSQALQAGADIIMLDNMDNKTMAAAVEMVAGRALTEASGNMTVATCGEVARLGVDLISMGALTHSYRSLDISLELELRQGGAPTAGSAV